MSRSSPPARSASRRRTTSSSAPTSCDPEAERRDDDRRREQPPGVEERDHFLRVVPELAWSREDRGSVSGSASGIAMQGRFRKLEVAASQRSLGKTFTSFEDRSTIAGRLREEANGWGRVDLGHDIQAEVDWRRALSDSPGQEGGGAGERVVPSGKVRLLRGGLPNLEVRRGRVLLDAEDARSEKWITRADLEISPDQAGFAPLGIRRLC